MRLLRLTSPLCLLLVGALAGCLRLPVAHRPPAVPVAHDTGSAAEAVLCEPVLMSSFGASTRYSGDGWTLVVPNAAKWRRAAEDRTTTLRLTRTVGGVRLGIALKAFAIRRDMPLETFLTAHRLWMAEEGSRPIEYAWDERLKDVRGYSVGGDRETQYAFRVAGDRAYVMEGSAAGGALSPRATEAFNSLVTHLRCRPRTSHA